MSTHDIDRQDLRCFLKVKMNCCPACKRNVPELLKNIEGVKGVDAFDVEQGKVLVIGDVDPNILVKKLKSINKNAEICGSMYNILAHDGESSRYNLPGNRRSGRRGGFGFLRGLFGKKKSNRSNNEDDTDIHNYPSTDNGGNENENENSDSETLELHSNTNTSDDHGISHDHGNDNTGHGSGMGETIPTDNYYPMNNQEDLYYGQGMQMQPPPPFEQWPAAMNDYGQGMQMQPPPPFEQWPTMNHYGQGMQMQPPYWPAMNQEHQQQEEAYNNNQEHSYLNIFDGFPNHDQYMKMQQQQQLGNQDHQQQDAYNNMYPPTMMYGEPSSSTNSTMQHDSNLVDPKPIYNDGYVYNWWSTN